MFFNQVQHTSMLTEFVPAKLTSIGEVVNENKSLFTNNSEEQQIEYPGCDQGT